MGSFRSILFVITTIFSVTHCYDLPFGLSLPNWFSSFTSAATGLVGASPRALSEFGSDLTSPSLSEKITKISWDIFGYMATMLGSVTRRMTQMRPNVEMAPGSFKTEILKYPENYFVNRLKTLLKIKKREEELNKPLNKPERK